ncbi:cilia- and flagella-associated protein 57 isoform X1 [Hydra vulgaris]|uniref:cilia- and flagella-associated protein 57 isoform X1 n=1 Tax=Hydra vulgaris TaxID=6087 RepID=UPI001F5E62DC|nr:cilia- and flagella-associated protein 57 [Hydra vulgaris]
MSIALASPRYAFGLRVGVSNNIAYIDEHVIIYPAGCNCILYNIDQRTQRFIAGTEGNIGMTAIAVSPNKRYVAIGEKGEKAVVSIYDLHSLKKKKVLSSPDNTSIEFVCLAFSPDSKNLIVQGGRPDLMLLYWAWEKSKLLASCKASNHQSAVAHQVTFNPKDNEQVCVIGHCVFKIFRFIENNLKQFGNQKSDASCNYTCQAWLNDEQLLIGTDSGKVLLFDNGDLKGEFIILKNDNSSVTQTVSKTNIGSLESNTLEPVKKGTDLTISCIITYSKGFVCSGGLGVYVFESSDDKEIFKKTKEIKIPLNQSNHELSDDLISCIALSPSEETLLASSCKNQLYAITLSSADLGKQDEAIEFELLAQSFHQAQITGMDVCIRKPLIATCGMDKSIRIWNFQNNSLELYKEFEDDVMSVALHPTGLFILAGFSDKLRCMNILIDDIRTVKEFMIRGCRECLYSNGGHLFAAVHGNVIQLYSSLTFENVGNFKGHSGKIHCLRWSLDDSKLVSCGTDGAIYEWNTLLFKREGENVLKSCSYTCLAMSPDSRTVYAVGSDHTIKEICDGQMLRDVPAGKELLSQVVLSHSGKMLFAGTVSGVIRSFKFPLTLPGQWQDNEVHAGTISKMKVSYDDQYLFTVSEDACLFIHKIVDKDGAGKRESDVPFAEEVLITRSDLEEKNTTMQELKTRVEELKMENEYQLRLKDMNYNETIKQLTEKFLQEIELLKTKNQILKTDREKEVEKQQEELADLLAHHNKQLEDIDTVNNKKLMTEYEKYQQLQIKNQRNQEEFEKLRQQMEESREKALQELTEFYEKKLQEKNSHLDNLNEELAQNLLEYEETKKQIEEDADCEILDINNKYEKRLRDEKDANLRLKGETGLMKRKFTSQQKEIEELKSEIQRLHGEEGKLQSTIESLEKDIYGLKKEIQEREETIQDKEKRIYDLKKKNQELEKFKFVLDYKIKELKKQIEPRENEVKALKEQIHQMENELERFQKQNTGLEINLAELRLKIKVTDNNLYQERRMVQDSQGVIKRFKSDLYNLSAFLQDPKKFKEGFNDLYEKYIGNENPENTNIDIDIHKEYARQREHLEKSIASLRKKLTKDSEIHRAENIRIIQENSTLINEINDLRRNLIVAKREIQGLEAAMKMLRKHQNLPTTPVNTNDEHIKLVELQKQEICRLRSQIADLEAKVIERSNSSNRLPPLHQLSI